MIKHILPLIALAESEVAFVLELLRHGHRTDLMSGNVLTASGKHQSWLYGLHRGDYLVLDLQLLNINFTPAQVQIMTTDTDRTFHTAEWFARGLYPFTHFSEYQYHDSLINPLQNTWF